MQHHRRKLQITATIDRAQPAELTTEASSSETSFDGKFCIEAGGQLLPATEVIKAVTANIPVDELIAKSKLTGMQ